MSNSTFLNNVIIFACYKNEMTGVLKKIERFSKKKKKYTGILSPQISRRSILLLSTKTIFHTSVCDCLALFLMTPPLPFST